MHAGEYAAPWHHRPYGTSQQLLREHAHGSVAGLRVTYLQSLDYNAWVHRTSLLLLL